MMKFINFSKLIAVQFILTVSILINEFKLSTQVSFLKDVTLTHIEKLKLDKFKNMVSSIVPHDYMKEDVYLIRWLRAKDFRLEEARDMLFDNLRWREENDMDNILNEDWSDFEREYKYSLEGCDLEGRPVATIYVGDFDTRKAVISGQGKKLMRYFDRFFEDMITLVRKAQKEGRNVTQYTEIYDMSNYNLRQQGCPLCIPVYIYLFQTYGNHFPGGAHRSILINTPAIFQSLWQILSPLLPESEKDIVSIYGRNKVEWQSELFREISKDQLTWEFGGNKEAPLDLKALRRNPNATYECN